MYFVFQLMGQQILMPPNTIHIVTSAHCTFQVSVDTFLVAARHQWVRGWCRLRALEHIQELLEIQSEEAVGLVEVVTKLGIILKKGLRYIHTNVYVDLQ